MVAGFLNHQLAATMWLGGARIVGIELGNQFLGQLCFFISLEQDPNWDHSPKTECTRL